MSFVFHNDAERALAQTLVNDVSGAGIRLNPSTARNRMSRAGIIVSTPPNKDRGEQGHSYLWTLTARGRSVCRLAGIRPDQAPRESARTGEGSDTLAWVTATRPHEDART